MSFFVSSNIKDIIDEKTYLSQENNKSSNMFEFKTDSVNLFSKQDFESINFNKNSIIKSIDFFLSLEEVNVILFKKELILEINSNECKKQTYLFKLLKIAKLEHNKYYCQFKILGEKS